MPPNSARAAAWSPEVVARQRADALENFDLNMKWFARLDAGEFQSALDGLLAKNPKFKAVDDLNDWDVPGVYIMVLDEYKQMYVGESGDKLRITAQLVDVTKGSIKRRIGQHWSNNKSFDRLIFGKVDESILSIDSFRAYDTTRIYACNVQDDGRGQRLELKVEKAVPDKFRLNRIRGGGIDGGFDALLAVETRYRRNLRGTA